MSAETSPTELSRTVTLDARGTYSARPSAGVALSALILASQALALGGTVSPVFATRVEVASST